MCESKGHRAHTSPVKSPHPGRDGREKNRMALIRECEEQAGTSKCVVKIFDTYLSQQKS